MPFRCNLFSWRRRRFGTTVDKEMQAPLSTSSKKNGKQKAGVPTTHTLRFYRGVEWTGPAPEFAPLGVVSCASTKRVRFVASGSLGAKIGLKPFDLIQSCSGTAELSSRKIKPIDLGAMSFEEATQHVRQGRVVVERPPREIWHTLAATMRECCPGASVLWLDAIRAVATGDDIDAIALATRLSAEHGPSVLARRITVEESHLVRLDLLARGEDLDPGRYLTDATLVELALESADRDLVSHLLRVASGPAVCERKAGAGASAGASSAGGSAFC